MATIYNKLTELVGNTPLLRLNSYMKAYKLKTDLLAKIEAFNPGGSIKDRVAKAMIEHAEETGLITRDTVLIEPTSGNTGIGLAWVAGIKGYKLILTMPESMSLERRTLLKALGAIIVLTPAAEGMKGAIAKAEQIRDEIMGAVILQQFSNQANPKYIKELPDRKYGNIPTEKSILLFRQWVPEELSAELALL